MKRNLTFSLVAVLLAGLLAGCAGTTVVINECTCPGEGGAQTADPSPDQPITGDQAAARLSSRLPGSSIPQHF